jgi:hypothetical protein
VLLPLVPSLLPRLHTLQAMPKTGHAGRQHLWQLQAVCNATPTATGPATPLASRMLCIQPLSLLLQQRQAVLLLLLVLNEPEIERASAVHMPAVLPPRADTDPS